MLERAAEVRDERVDRIVPTVGSQNCEHVERHEFAHRDRALD